MKQIVFAILSIAILGTYAGCKDPGGRIIEDRYENKSLGFSIQIPEGWVEAPKPEDPPGASVEFFYKHPANDSLICSLAIYDRTIDFDSYLEQTRDSMERAGYRIIAEDEDSKAGFKIYNFTYDFHGNQVSLNLISIKDKIINIGVGSLMSRNSEGKEYEGKEYERMIMESLEKL